MALAVQTIANRLLGWAAPDWSYDMSSPPNGLLDSVAAAITGAESEMRSEAAECFSQPREKRLAAPSVALSVTIGGSALTLDAASGIPNAGVTVLITGATGGHNRILSLNSGTTWNLMRTHEGGNGATTATVWDDAWVAADGITFESLVGEVRLDGKPLIDARSEAGMAMLYNRFERGGGDYGRWHGKLFEALTPTAGTPAYYWTELVQTSINAAPEERLRIFPMPSAAATLAARVALRATPVAASDFSATTRKVGAPGGKEEELFMPLAKWHWAQTPFWKPDATQMRSLERAYAAAVEKLKYYHC